MPAINRCVLRAEGVVEIEEWLQSATAMEPGQARWRGTSAFLAEQLGDTQRAADNTSRELADVLQAQHQAGSLLAPTDLRELQKRARPRAGEPVTYRAAYDSQKQTGPWIQAAFFAEFYLRAMLDFSLVDLPVSKSGAEALSPAVACIRETVTGMSEEGGIGWSLAEDFLDRCRKIAHDAPATEVGFVDLATEFDGIQEKLIKPRKAAWEAQYQRVLSSSPGENGATS